MLKNIPQARLLLYVVLIGLAPIFFVLTKIYGKYSELQNLSSLIESVQVDGLNLERKQGLNKVVHQHYLGADRFYIDKHLESLNFLEDEKESLREIIDQESFIIDASMIRRLKFLENENRLRFSEGAVETYENFTETEASLRQPVELSLPDLQQVIARIEGVKIGPFEPLMDRPQVIITDFRLRKRQTPGGNEVFTLNLKFLKREFF